MAQRRITQATPKAPHTARMQTIPAARMITRRVAVRSVGPQPPRICSASRGQVSRSGLRCRPERGPGESSRSSSLVTSGSPRPSSGGSCGVGGNVTFRSVLSARANEWFERLYVAPRAGGEPRTQLRGTDGVEATVILATHRWAEPSSATSGRHRAISGDGLTVRQTYFLGFARRHTPNGAFTRSSDSARVWARCSYTVSVGLDYPRWWGARPDGWVGLGRSGAGGIGSVTGSPAVMVIGSPW